MDASANPENLFRKSLRVDETILWVDKPNQEFVSRKQSSSVLYGIGLPLLVIIAGLVVFRKELFLDIYTLLGLFMLLALVGFMYKHTQRDSTFRDASTYAVTNQRVMTLLIDHEYSEDFKGCELSDLDLSRLIVKSESVDGIGTITHRAARAKNRFHLESIQDVEKVGALIRIAHEECSNGPKVQQSAPKLSSPL